MTDENTPPYEYPKLRNIDAMPATDEKQGMIILYDPSHLSDKSLLVPQDILYTLQFLDGSHSLLDIRAEYMRAFGTFLFEDRLSKLLHDLDECLFLENDRYAEYMDGIRESFRKSIVRESMFAGQSYPAEPEELHKQLSDYFEAPEGPGLPEQNQNKRSIKGLVAPHIDIHAGGVCYAHAYKTLAEAEPADLYVILGTCHTPMQRAYTATLKNFQTPFGTVETDSEFISSLGKKFSYDLFEDELMHRTEHTIEFQLIFLQHILKTEFTIAPILCSFSHEALLPKSEQKNEIELFCRNLRRAIQTHIGRVCVIASVDFSHVGPRYGDEQAPDANFLSLVQRFDNDLLECLEVLDADSFTATLTSSNNRYRICGFAPLYTLLKSIETNSGKLLNYSNARMDSSGSTVTFASMVFE